MEKTITDAQMMLNVLMDMGTELMNCNSEIHRIEDTIERMGIVFGAEKMEVFAINTSIVVTMLMPDGTSFTQTHRNNNPHGFDFIKLSRLNQLSREYCSNPCSVAELKDHLQRIISEDDVLKNSRKIREYIGCILVGGGFSIYFGGTIIDGVAGALFGGLTCLTQNIVKRIAPNQLIVQLLNAFLIGMLIEGVGSNIQCLQVDKIMIGNIMILIPGVSMTNSLKDILTGETIAGLTRFIEAFMWAGALAAGFMLSMKIVHLL